MQSCDFITHDASYFYQYICKNGRRKKMTLLKQKNLLQKKVHTHVLQE